MKLKNLHLSSCLQDLENMKGGKSLINTINAYSYVVAQNDVAFQEALIHSDLLLPDGQSILWACQFLKTNPIPQRRIAGSDLFDFEMQQLAKSNILNPKVMFLGSTEDTLSKIRKKVAEDYPNFEVITFSPPYKEKFSDEDSQQMLAAINAAKPHLLWIGMTAPKQEKWTYEHFQKMDVLGPVGCIGAVFDFYSGKVHRAPEWMQRAGLEWLFRLCSEPRRLWRRYLIGNIIFLYLIVKEKTNIN